MGKTRSAEIICIGTELLMGDIINTNAAYIAKELANLGVNLYHQTVVGDNAKRLEESLRLAFSRVDIVITTGGLGPTYDDMSKESIAAFFGRKLVLHEESLKNISCFFSKIGRPMTQNNKKQALLPEGCIVFENPNGTAPGCAIEGTGELSGKTVIMLPGPPREMRPMFDNLVRPYLHSESETALISRSLYFFGIGESTLEDKLHKLMTESQNPTVAPYAKTGEVMLRITARVGKNEEAEAILNPVINEILSVAGEYLYGIDVGDLQTAAVHALKEKGLHVATAESCTGGYLSKRITDVSGASSVFECGICSYSDKIKNKLLNVSQELLNTYGAVSEQAAEAMASGIRKLACADIGVSVTGNAGPTASEGKAVGLVYIGVDSENYKKVITLKINRRDEDLRETIRYLASSHALDLIIKAARAA